MQHYPTCADRLTFINLNYFTNSGAQEKCYILSYLSFSSSARSLTPAPQEQPDANGSLTSNTSPSLGDDPADKTSSPLGSTSLFFDIIGEEQQNGNNNNPCKILQTQHNKQIQKSSYSLKRSSTDLGLHFHKAVGLSRDCPSNAPSSYHNATQQSLQILHVCKHPQFMIQVF